jgi:hypothetical protein
MKYICNQCTNIFEADDITIHYKTGEKGLEIASICQCCLDEYLKKLKVDDNKKIDNNERMKMKRRW